MSRTSINKERLAQLEAIERNYLNMIADLKELASKEGSTKSFVSVPHDLDVSVTNNGNVNDWS